jgi:hypothetical protein
MSWGSLLVGLALLLLVGAFVARPFRRARVIREQAIEGWVAQVRVEQEVPAGEDEGGHRADGGRPRPGGGA